MKADRKAGVAAAIVVATGLTVHWYLFENGPTQEKVVKQCRQIVRNSLPANQPITNIEDARKNFRWALKKATKYEESPDVGEETLPFGAECAVDWNAPSIPPGQNWQHFQAILCGKLVTRVGETPYLLEGPCPEGKFAGFYVSIHD